MKKILLFTSILFLTITTSLLTDDRGIDTAFISKFKINKPKLHYEMLVTVNQTAPNPVDYKCIVGYFPIPSLFVSYFSTDITTALSLNFTSLLPNVDYCIRLVDSASYYSANGGSSSGTSSIGVYDEFCSVNFSEPSQLTASTSIVASNLCAGDCIAAEDLLVSGGTGPHYYQELVEHFKT